MAANQLRFDISIPQFVEDRAFEPLSFRAYLARAEALGFESAWTGEQILGSTPYLGPIQTLTFAAACTSRVRLGCAALVSPHHSPLHLAKSLATLDQLSEGRLDVVLVTESALRSQSAFGVQRNTVIERFEEGLRLLRSAWNDERVSFQGRFWQLDDGVMEPKPWQKPAPPVWFGGGGPRLLRRTAQSADGFFGAGSSTAAQFAGHVRTLRTELTAAGRDPDSFPIAKRVYIGVDDDLDRARKRMAESLERLYGYFGLPDLTPVAAFGPPEVCAQALRDVADAGARLIVLNPLYDDAAQMDRLAREVIPNVTKTAASR
jgi:probable F420-dependent oxidoreductase